MVQHAMLNVLQGDLLVTVKVVGGAVQWLLSRWIDMS
ncbi:hypothetical protein CLV68_1017 [Actinokineospora cianjurensis]|uniref:Uncharacterized protein n=1 Tax=Actinokineospora cianjurensis TaxID=585224 RepID=A0A421B7W4_9PSEU|nr:hypothetical protein CLV68_1017 [Actinokineospora cianjurensis]